MKSVEIKLSYINDVREIVAAATEATCDVDLVSGRYIVDAKSIIGIFSLDFTRPIRVDIHGTEEEAQTLIEKIEKYVVAED